MALIKVTGYIDTDDLNPEHVDLGHEMGLSSEGYEAFASVSIQGDGISAYLDSVEFKLDRPGRGRRA